MDLQTLIAEYGLFIAKNWVCELGVEGVDDFGRSVFWMDEGDVHGIV